MENDDGDGIPTILWMYESLWKREAKERRQNGGTHIMKTAVNKALMQKEKNDRKR